MKTRVKTEDIEIIKYWADKGLSAKDIHEITGWSISTISRARNGVEAFKKDREKQRIAQQKRAKRSEETEVPAEINDTAIEEVDEAVPDAVRTTFVTCEEANSLSEIVELLKAQNKMLSELLDLWR